uniref:hypothetical protein n=1 Tax=Spizellomyces sp. 'palustris' TaxID=117820 RepID=UPI0010FBDB82|nr:hypothetical protein [Spizellomyces sp. 'palustris']QCQ69049.1 hypothetical protein [Spizellomyces sp. 'palustris']
MTMKKLSMLSSGKNLVVTPKIDGVIKFLFVLDGIVLSTGLTKDIKHICKIDETNIGITILDSEYIDKIYYVIDIIVHKGEYIGDMDFEKRISIRNNVTSLLPDFIIPKQYNSFNSFKDLNSLYLSYKKQYKIDGLIFLDKSKGYMQRVIKWKESSTVDLEIYTDEDGSKKIKTCDDWSIDMPWENHECVEGIWEFEKRANILVPTRLRLDKPQANSLEIVEKNLVDSIPGTIFTGIGCYLMRKYHNRVKIDMLRSSHDMGSVIMDIGTGQGGDVIKWRRAKLIYCIEPSVKATQEMEQRYGYLPNVFVINSLLKDVDPSTIP